MSEIGERRPARTIRIGEREVDILGINVADGLPIIFAGENFRALPRFEYRGYIKFAGGTMTYYEGCGTNIELEDIQEWTGERDFTENVRLETCGVKSDDIYDQPENGRGIMPEDLHAFRLYLAFPTFEQRSLLFESESGPRTIYEEDSDSKQIFLYEDRSDENEISKIDILRRKAKIAHEIVKKYCTILKDTYGGKGLLTMVRSETSESLFEDLNRILNQRHNAKKEIFRCMNRPDKLNECVIKLQNLPPDADMVAQMEQEGADHFLAKYLKEVDDKFEVD